MSWPVSRPSRNDVLFWSAHVAFWAAGFAAGLTVAKAFAPTLADPQRFVGLRVAIGFFLSAVLRWLSKRDDVRRRIGVSQAGLMIGGPIAGGVLMTLLTTAMETSTDDGPMRLGLVARLLLDVAILAAWSAAYFGIHLLREGRSNELRALEAESLAYQNELKLLQSQISPHFLFNALNTVLACKNDPEAIETVTHALSKYLRFLLRQSGSLEPLGREFDALEEYLTIQSFRFGDQLTCRIECAADIRGIPVLPMMVQPLLENALKHGAAEPPRPLEVHIHAWREADRLFVEVANTGRWKAVADAASTGTGLQTLRRRLALHGGPTATLTFREEEGWIRALVTIPLAPEYAAPRPAVPESKPRGTAVETAR